MASINGWQLKGIKTWQGRDWDGVQGTLYFNGKKAGWYSDNGDGGPADITMFTKEMKEQFDNSVKAYYDKHPLQGEYAKLTPDGELFMGELLRLVDNEKSYKKMAKEGLPYVVAFKENPNSPYVTIVGVRTEEGRKQFIAKKGIKEYEPYNSLDDFNVA